LFADANFGLKVRRLFKAFQILFAISSGVIATVVLLAFVLRVIDARLDLAFVPNTAWVETSFGELPQGDVDIQRTPGGLTIQLRCHALEFYRWRKEAPRNLADGFILSLKEPGMSDDKIVDTLLEWIAFSNKIDRTTAVYGDSLTFNGGELDVRISA
jgi:hypothetical protein